MADLEVDLDGLVSFAGTLDRVRGRLDGARAQLRGADDELGDAAVVEGLEHFEAHWRDGRESIATNAETLSTMVTDSVRTYRQVDDDLTAQLQRGTRL